MCKTFFFQDISQIKFHCHKGIDTMVITFQFLRMNPNAKYSSEIGCQSLWAVPQLQNNSPSFCPRKIEIKRDATDIWWLALIDTGRLFVTPCQSVWLMDWATRKIPEWILSPLASTKAVSDREIRMFFVSNQPGRWSHVATNDWRWIEDLAQGQPIHRQPTNKTQQK